MSEPVWEVCDEGSLRLAVVPEQWRAQIRRALQDHFTPVALGVWRIA